MLRTDSADQGRFHWTGALASLPAGVRVMLTAFLAIIGVGYLVALLNIFHSHQMADGKAGLSMDDLRAVYGGLAIDRSAGGEVPSRMLTMLRTQMRQYAQSEADFAVLEGWLKAGAAEAGLDAGEQRQTPRRAIVRNCLRCHAASTGTDISKKSPFGPDEFTVDHAMLQPLLTTTTTAAAGLVETPPQLTVPRLVLLSHQHMLAMPLFALAVGVLFTMTRFPPSARSILAPLPMMAMVLDFAGWWLARIWMPSVYVIAAAGAAFAATLGLQIAMVTFDIWRPRRRPR